MRIVLISDTHGWHRRIGPVPDGDLIVHAGDCTKRGNVEDTRDFLEWFGALPHPRKVMIAGNHDFLFERDPARAESLIPPEVTYLRDAGTEVGGIRIWGSPWQPWFHDWAFNLERGDELAAKWRLIPGDTDLLVTHGPPHGTLDQTIDRPPRSVGCEALTARLAELPGVRLHVFGHIHEAYGEERREGRHYVNASICDVRYRPVNPPIVTDL
ncbi:MAG: metallophosphatase domain-containing protein [Gemmatimonadales bacterium]